MAMPSSMIADAEVAREIAMRHIMSAKTANPHTLIRFAVIDKKCDPPLVQYPPYEEPSSPAALRHAPPLSARAAPRP